MSFLGDLLNTLGGAAHNVGQGVQNAENTVAHAIQPALNQGGARSLLNVIQGAVPALGHPALPMAQMAHRLAQPQQQYAQYMNPDGSGGGFGSLPPQQMPNLPNALQGGPDNPGYVPFQNGGFGAPGAFQLQGGQDLQLQSGNSRQNLTPRF